MSNQPGMMVFPDTSTTLASFAEAQQAIAEIVTWYNEQRLHSALGYLTPASQASTDHRRLSHFG